MEEEIDLYLSIVEEQRGGERRKPSVSCGNRSTCGPCSQEEPPHTHRRFRIGLEEDETDEQSKMVRLLYKGGSLSLVRIILQCSFKLTKTGRT